MVDNSMHVDADPRPRKSAMVYFFEKLPPWASATCAIFFLFTIWSVFTGFSLGDIMNKYADSNLKQNEMQFQAQLEMQKMQFSATEQGNTTLHEIKAAVDTMVGAMDTLNSRVSQLEATTGLIATWTCLHGHSKPPQYCEAMR